MTDPKTSPRAMEDGDIHAGRMAPMSASPPYASGFGPSPEDAALIARALLDEHAKTCPTCGRARRNSRAQNIAGIVSIGILFVGVVAWLIG